MRSRLLPPPAALLFVFVTACGGSDATAPNRQTVDAAGALQSLASGMGALSGTSSTPLSTALNPALGAAASQVTQASVTVDGTSVPMFALAMRTVFPAGTCLEQLIPATESPFLSGECTPPPGGLVLVLWHTTAASQPPDRMAIVMADVGAVRFTNWLESESVPALTTFPPMAIYMEPATRALWLSTGGSLTSSVAPGAPCTLPVPAFAKSATCTLASFGTAGAITFVPLDLGTLPQGSRTTHTLVIPSQTLSGVVETITQITPVNLTGH